ncbi:nitroreductase family protein [Saccharopolyspora sp. HNM0983]|uniref:Nitroreductase family protein n=1 Tax=Saccharopolyspora montiporae TaxID=2781240 RepID=A0A929B8W0_9PSEU|nr:nitroreductase family protein [Saccharopolyspora sp. HNM0983]MBE9373556.1 nitroreductase family protein [Saccharopolyspora sp. HNM0983]
MRAIPPTLGLTTEQTRDLLALAGRAPSLHNTQPWRFTPHPDVLEVHADPQRRLPHTDPDDRELRLACGAAVLNLRLALQQHGLRPQTTLLPHGPDSTTLAAIHTAGQIAAPTDTALYRAITQRRTTRKPFRPEPVPTTDLHALRAAADTEHATLHPIDRDQRAPLLRLARHAHHTQQDDPGIRTEFATWTGRDPTTADGVPATSTGPRPEPQDEWVLRDFSRGNAGTRTPGKDFEDDPLIAVLTTTDTGHKADLRAGQAMQRTLLQATARGLATSFLSQIVEDPTTRQQLHDLLGAPPAAVLRIGYGPPVPATPRRDPTDLLT